MAHHHAGVGELRHALLGEAEGDAEPPHRHELHAGLGVFKGFDGLDLDSGQGAPGLELLNDVADVRPANLRAIDLRELLRLRFVVGLGHAFL